MPRNAPTNPAVGGRRSRWLPFLALFAAAATQLLGALLLQDAATTTNDAGALAAAAGAGLPPEIHNRTGPDGDDNRDGSTIGGATSTNVRSVAPGRAWEPPDLNAGFQSDPELPLLAVVSLNADRTSTNRDGLESTGWMYRMSYNNKKRYCERWGFDFIVEDGSVVDQSRDVRWGKILTLRKWLPWYQWLLWMDLDTLIMRFDLPLHDLISNDVDMIVTRDWNGLNSGVFFLRNSPYSFDMLRQVWSTPQRYLRRFNDQAGFNSIINSMKNKEADIHMRHFRFLPQREMNSFPDQFAILGNGTFNSSLYRPGDRIAHFPGCGFQTTCRSTVTRFYRDMLRTAGIDDIDATAIEGAVRPPGNNHSVGVRDQVQLLNGRTDVWNVVPVHRLDWAEAHKKLKQK